MVKTINSDFYVHVRFAKTVRPAKRFQKRLCLCLNLAGGLQFMQPAQNYTNDISNDSSPPSEMISAKIFDRKRVCRAL